MWVNWFGYQQKIVNFCGSNLTIFLIEGDKISD